MRIQIQLLLSKMLHRQLFIVNLLERLKYSRGFSSTHYHSMSDAAECARKKKTYGKFSSRRKNSHRRH